VALEGREVFYFEGGIHMEKNRELAEAYGIKGLRACNKEEAQQIWQEAFMGDCT
jgi:thiamine pyrophosphate-dependent acetolactate synthase large subunit-like protein